MFADTFTIRSCLGNFTCRFIKWDPQAFNIDCSTGNITTCSECSCSSNSSVLEGERDHLLSVARLPVCYHTNMLTRSPVNLWITSAPGLQKVWDFLKMPEVLAAFFTGVLLSALVCVCDRRCCRRCELDTTVQSVKQNPFFFFFFFFKGNFVNS